LTGTDGKVTIALSNVLSPNDLYAVFPKDSDRRLALVPTNINPFRLIGTAPRWIQLLGEADDPAVGIPPTKKLFNVWPNTAIGDLNILVKQNKEWNTTVMADVMWMDSELLILHALMTETKSDGANQAEQAGFAQQFNDRLKQLTKDNANIPTEINPGSATSPMVWFDPAEFQ
jgi:hypothetical protein